MPVVSLAHMARSDDYFRDAQGDSLSPTDRRDAAFEAGYPGRRRMDTDNEISAPC